MIHNRLDSTERLEVRPGAVFIWEERSTALLEGSNISGTSGGIRGIERWTDGLKWGPSRVREVSDSLLPAIRNILKSDFQDFLFYAEREPQERPATSPGANAPASSSATPTSVSGTLTKINALMLTVFSADLHL